MAKADEASRLRPRNDLGQYDDLVDEWWEPRGKFAMLHWIATARAELIPPATGSAEVLVDLACGGGLMAPHAQRLGYRHIGVDITASALRVSASRGVTPVRGDVGAIPLRDACAAVVTAGEILEHVADPQRVLAEAIRVVRPGGLVVIDSIAATRRARLLAVTLAERLPGLAPRGIHDPGLFVDRDALLALAARHGVPMTIRGIGPDIVSTVAWLLGRRDAARLVPQRSSAVLFQAWGRKVLRDRDTQA